ncbi:MAG: DUF4136 domain-containing protein [Janthinobacterium lividum]
MPKRAFLLFAVASTLALTGCATRWVVESDVRSFSSLTPDAGVAPGATYRFERLPSQLQDERGAHQADSLEALAAPALDAVGLARDDVAPRYSVQIGARVGLTLSPWDDPWLGPWGFGGGWGPRSYAGLGVGVGVGRFHGRGYGGYGGWGGAGFGPGFGGGWYDASTPWYSREVSVLLRELATNRVVYETRARNDGPYSSDAPVLRVMFQAALQGFPVPPQGERRVDIELAPKAAK